MTSTSGSFSTSSTVATSSSSSSSSTINDKAMHLCVERCDIIATQREEPGHKWTSFWIRADEKLVVVKGDSHDISFYEIQIDLFNRAHQVDKKEASNEEVVKAWEAAFYEMKMEYAPGRGPAAGYIQVTIGKVTFLVPLVQGATYRPYSDKLADVIFELSRQVDRKKITEQLAAAYNRQTCRGVKRPASALDNSDSNVPPPRIIHAGSGFSIFPRSRDTPRRKYIYTHRPRQRATGLVFNDEVDENPNSC